MTKLHRAISVFLVGGTIALLFDKFRPADKIEKKVEDAIDG